MLEVSYFLVFRQAVLIYMITNQVCSLNQDWELFALAIQSDMQLRNLAITDKY